MDISLAVLTGTAYGEVLQRAAVAAHGMTLEVVQCNHEVVVGHVSSYNVVLDIALILHGNAHLVVFVHDVHREILQKAMTLDDLPVVSRRIAVVLLVTWSAAVGGVALHDGTVHLEYQVLYAQCLVDFYQ